MPQAASHPVSRCPSALFFSAAAVIFATAMGSEEKADLIVKTKHGLVRGNINGEGSRQFVSIPFAAPPVGNLRFRPPQQPKAWKGVRDCSCRVCMTLPMCLQTSPLTGKKKLLLPPSGPGQEDCLYLHVYTPYPVPAKPVPVALWLYGGGFQTGDASFSRMYSGAQLAQKHGLVVVAPNYRLGALGFLAHEFLSSDERGGKGGSVGNYGMLDQRFAMMWIQDNIASFGGDPKKVTVFGQSAGAFSIAAHLASPLSAGLFHGAISQSSNFEDFFYVPKSTAMSFGASWSSNIGCDGKKLAKEKFLQCMRNVSAKVLVEGTMFPEFPAVRPFLYPALPWGPVIDGVFLKDYPRNLIAKGQFHRMPVMIGTVHDEGSMFGSAFATMQQGTKYPPDTEEDLKHLLRKFLKTADVDKALKLYPLTGFASNCTGYLIPSHKQRCLLKWQASALFTDYFFTCSSREMARTLVSQNQSVWMYEFNYKFEEEGMYKAGMQLQIANVALSLNSGEGGLGTFHMSELPFLFGTKTSMTSRLFVGNQFSVSGGWTKSHQNMSDTMQEYWTSMFKTGAPRSAHGPTWPQYKNGETMVLDVPSKIASLSTRRCHFWDGIGYHTPHSLKVDNVMHDAGSGADIMI